MDGLMEFCYKPVLPSVRSNIPANATFQVWYNNDFGLCFEYLVFATFLNALFGFTSALYAGTKYTKIKRRRTPVALAIRAAIALCVVVNTLVEFTASFELARGRPYSVLLAEVVLIISWSAHLLSILVLCSSVRHSGRGPVTLHAVWFLLFIGDIIHFRTIIRWSTDPSDYQYPSSDDDDGYFALLLRITAYVHFGLQCLYAITLIFRVSPVITGDDIKFPRNVKRLYLGLAQNRDEEGECLAAQQHLVTSETDNSSNYGSISVRDPQDQRKGTVDFSKLEASEDKANFLSLLSFWWVQPLMKRGDLGFLQKPEDLLQLPESLKTSNVREKFQTVLQQYKRGQSSTIVSSTPHPTGGAKNGLDTCKVAGQMKESETSRLLHSLTSSTRAGTEKRSPERNNSSAREDSSSRISLFWALNRAFGLHYYPLGVLKLLADGLGFAGPLLLHALVSFMENRNEPMAHGYYYALGLFLSTLFGAIITTHFNYQISKVGLKVRGALITEVYRKTLYVNSTTLSEFSTGQVVNFMSTDTDRIVNFCQSFHQFWSLPFQIAISLYLLHQQVGLAFLTGLGFCVLLIPINRWLAVKIGKLSTEMMAQKDERVKVMSEILTGIRVIKFYAWENTFTKKILRLRTAELKSLKGRKYLDALCVYFWATTPVLISMLTFTTYVALGNKLTAAKVFTSVALFNILISPLNAFPWVINGLMEAWVSTKRVRRFLQLEELDWSKYYHLQCNVTANDRRHSAAPEDGSSSSADVNRDVNGDGPHATANGRQRSAAPDDGTGISVSDTNNGDGPHVAQSSGDSGVDDSSPCGGNGSSSEGNVVWIRDGCFTWRKKIKEVHADSQTRPSDSSQTGRTADEAGKTGSSDQQGGLEEPTVWMLADMNLSIKPGQLIGVIGTVGSGKSSLLAAITAEMRRTHGQISVRTLEDGFGFTAQEAWIQHATVKENILFGQPFDPEKYSAVVFACALEQDLQVLPDGDRTEVGENGVTLSGGQKARLALARAVYQDKELYLLDDPLAAVDAHVATHLFHHCIMGLLRHKTRVLCTHHFRFLHAADVVMVMEGGVIKSIGPPSAVLPQVEKHMLEEKEGGEEGGEEEGGEEESKGKVKQNQADVDGAAADAALGGEHVLVREEEKEVGVVAFTVYRAYWSAVGNILAPVILLALFLMQASRNVSDWWLAYWISHTHVSSTFGTNISAYNITHSFSTPEVIPPLPLTHSPEYIPALPIVSASDNLAFYLGIYGGLAAANSVFTLFRAFLYAYGGICAATVLHKKLLRSILRAPVSFFDVTPIGRIVNRFSSDLYAIDDSLPFILNILLAQFYGLLGTIAVTCYGLPWFTLLLVPLGVLYYHIQKFYRRTSRELKRLSTVTLSPVYAHFSESLAGLCTIRALRASDRFAAENEERVDINQRANFGSYAVAQWLGIQLQMLGVAMVVGVAFIAVLEHHFSTVDPGLVGLAISYALSVTNLLSGVVTSFTETEKQMVSVERAMQYIHGAPSEREGGAMEPPLNWPTEGVVEFRKAVLMYREGHPPALEDVSLATRPAEKIGVVGRTGAGKSSLFQALFRMVELRSGSVLIDGVDIATLPLDQLRSVLAVIPQDPFLFSGSVRENLDPCAMHSDQELWSVLERCHLRIAVRDLGGLYVDVEEKGRMFSVGQRQLICLARALLTGAKVICVDEATASVDLHTDAQIQQTIRSEFTDSTVITIAHRIETVVNSDRILVMEHGHVRELGTPAELLDDPGSLFSALFREHCK